MHARDVEAEANPEALEAAFSGGSGSGSSKIHASRHPLLLMTKKIQKAKFCQHICLFSQKNNVNQSKMELWTVLVMPEGQHLISKSTLLSSPHTAFQ